jgi:uncharacterized phage protein (TIGR01671 family)
MREYRGKRGNTWVYGYLISDYQIRAEDKIESYPCKKETIGQYTGLTDRTGAKIFEGDIVRDENGVIWKIGCHDGIYIKAHRIGKDKMCCPQFLAEWLEKSEVIGNVHDDKNLLEGAE